MWGIENENRKIFKKAGRCGVCVQQTKNTFMDHFMTTEGLQTIKFLNDVHGSKSVREMFGHDGILNIYFPNLAVDAQPIWEPTTKECRFKEHNPVRIQSLR